MIEPTDQWLRMQYADEGQPNFGNWEVETIGEVGEYGKQIVFTQLGEFRQRVIRLRCSSPRRRDILGAVAQLIPTQG